MALITRDPNVINDIEKGGKHDIPSMTLFRSTTENLDERLKQESSEREAADAKEKAEREQADKDLSDALNQEIADRTDADNAEKEAREQADEDILDALRQEIADRTEADAAEKAAREEADNKEKSEREQADQSLSDALAKEIADRIAADAVLQTNINNEATARANADTAINTRITNLQFSDIGGMIPGTRVYAY